VTVERRNAHLNVTPTDKSDQLLWIVIPHHVVTALLVEERHHPIHLEVKEATRNRLAHGISPRQLCFDQVETVAQAISGALSGFHRNCSSIA
jgi:hypothetical protein